VESCLTVEVRFEPHVPEARRKRVGDAVARPPASPAAQEDDPDPVEEIGLEGGERLDEEPDAFPLAQLPEERQAPDAGAGRCTLRRLVERRGLADVRDHLRRIGHAPAVRAHPVQQPSARADDRVREPDRDALGDVLAEAIERVRHLLGEFRQDAARRVAVDDERCIAQREARLAGTQCREAETAPIVHDRDLRRILPQRMKDLERRRKVRRPHVFHTVEHADLDVRRLVASHPLRA
jgi:hypothetical protein